MKNVLKISLAALTFSLVMLLSPTQINATYLSLENECRSTFGATCDCAGSCSAGIFRCRCKKQKN